MRQIRRLALVAAAVSLTAGCASAGGSPARSTGGSRNVIVAAELEGGGFDNLRDAVRRLRPAWLRPRGSTGTTIPGELPVYMDNVRAGDMERLTSIPVELVKEVRFLDPREATFRWGTGHTRGAIEVISKATGGGIRQ